MEQQTVTATVFIPPNGRRRVIEITKVHPEDATYIKQHNINVSLEELMTGDTVVYFDDGKHIDDDPEEEPDEIIVISRNGKKTCEDCIKEGVELLKKRGEEDSNCPIGRGAREKEGVQDLIEQEATAAESSNGAD